MLTVRNSSVALMSVCGAEALLEFAAEPNLIAQDAYQAAEQLPGYLKSDAAEAIEAPQVLKKKRKPKGDKISGLRAAEASEAPRLLKKKRKPKGDNIAGFRAAEASEAPRLLKKKRKPKGDKTSGLRAAEASEAPRLLKKKRKPKGDKIFGLKAAGQAAGYAAAGVAAAIASGVVSAGSVVCTCITGRQSFSAVFASSDCIWCISI